MTNKEINDFTKELVTWFRNYRNQRPIKDEKTLDEAWDSVTEIVNRYGRYDSHGNAKNMWILHLADGWFHELMEPERENG